MAQETDKALIRKFIAGKCTPQEQQYMKVFLQQPGSDDLFNEILAGDWQGFKKEEPSTDAYIQGFRQKLIKRLYARPRLSVQRLAFYRHAAIWTILVLGAATYSVWRYNKKNMLASQMVMLSTHNPYGQRSNIILADSSVVTLGAGSTLKYPERFAGNTREISLEGEALFKVTKNPKKPFIVHTGTVQTRVLGTSFKIDAFKDQLVSVAVATGKVRVGRTAPDNTGLQPLAVLLPGDEVKWNPQSGKATVGHVQTEDITGWEKGKLSFVGVPLSEIAITLERWYNVKITIRNKKIRDYRMSIILDGTLPLNSVLDILKITVKARCQVKGDTIIIE